MRRKDKERQNKAAIEKILNEAKVCRLGLFDGVKPYIVPMNYGYKAGILYFHSAREGRKVEILKKNPVVCFEIDIPGSVVSSEEACSWSINYRSVMGEGTAAFVSDENKKEEALRCIMDHYSGKTEWSFSSEMLKKTLVFAVKAENITVKESET
ncbi:MAG: pyridoxamine 5'-phosphate oxidase family protein [Spirochaetes bacterium]|nr:MAG: pyridoxamine 5'-phosphate oxidase family protein [Spirochaetota bacterium]